MDGKDILTYFDNRVASQLLLGEAIDRKLLSPFLYFGLSDSVDYSTINWIKGKYDISELENVYTADDIRARLILSSLIKYTTNIDDVKALGFCVSIKHATFMASYFNKHGVSALSLSSKSSEDERNRAKQSLVKGSVKIIFTVDLYNEGVDIPEVNTVLFLRPTESSTIFLQQLGRGLRLCENKEYLLVLDFIGNSNKKYNFITKYKSLLDSRGSTNIRKSIENGFFNLPRGCFIEFEKVAKEHILRNLNQSEYNKSSLISQVKYFKEDTSLELTLSNFLSYYNISLYNFYTKDGRRSMYRFKRWAGLIESDDDVSDEIYKSFVSLFHINSPKLLSFILSYIKDRRVKSEEEKLMLNMLYYSFYQVPPKEKGFTSIADGVDRILSYDYIKSEIVEILEYNLSQIKIVPRENDYTFTSPLEVYASYNIRQILAAFGYYNEISAPSFREGVKYFKDKKCDIFLINLNKSEKEFSPSTMYEDYAINSQLFHWQSQSTVSLLSETAARYINHKKRGSSISLFVRERKEKNSYILPYTFLGSADYVSHEGSKPVSFIWRLKNEIPASMIKIASKSVAN